MWLQIFQYPYPHSVDLGTAYQVMAHVFGTIGYHDCNIMAEGFRFIYLAFRFS